MDQDSETEIACDNFRVRPSFEQSTHSVEFRAECAYFIEYDYQERKIVHSSVS